MMKTTTHGSPAAYPPVQPTRLALAIRRHLALAATACVIAGAAQPAQAFDPVFELSSLDGSNGFVLNGITSYRSFWPLGVGRGGYQWRRGG